MSYTGPAKANITYTGTGVDSSPIFTLPIGLQVFTYVDFTASPYTVLPEDRFLLVDTTGGPVTIEMENARLTGDPLVIKDYAGNAHIDPITVTTVGGIINIDGSTSQIMSSTYSANTFVLDGAQYYIY